MMALRWLLPCALSAKLLGPALTASFGLASCELVSVPGGCPRSVTVAPRATTAGRLRGARAFKTLGAKLLGTFSRSLPGAGGRSAPDHRLGHLFSASHPRAVATMPPRQVAALPQKANPETELLN